MRVWLIISFARRTPPSGAHMYSPAPQHLSTRPTAPSGSTDLSYHRLELAETTQATHAPPGLGEAVRPKRLAPRMVLRHRLPATSVAARGEEVVRRTCRDTNRARNTATQGRKVQPAMVWPVHRVMALICGASGGRLEATQIYDGPICYEQAQIT